MPSIVNALGFRSVFWLALGGVLYSIGAVFYAVKPKFITSKVFGCHEIFHCFVLAGSLCHLIVMMNLCALSLI
jgi:hemolysin III